MIFSIFPLLFLQLRFMKTEDIIAKQLRSLIPLDNNELKTFFSMASKKSIKKHDFFCKPGQRISHFYFLETGIARHYYQDKNDKEHTKHFIFGKRFFVASLSDYIEHTPSKLYCQALEDATVYYWNLNKILTIAESNHKWYKLFYVLAGRAFVGKEQKELEYYTLDATQRYINFSKKHKDILNRIPNTQIASYLNISPETLSRLKKKILFE